MEQLATTTLGRTGLQITRLAAGGHFTVGATAHHDHDRRVREIHHMIDAGITYFDIQWEPEELAVAEVMKSRRDEMTIAWPLHGVTQQGGGLTAQYVVDYCKDHQARYGIEHVDILLWVGMELYPKTQDAAMDALRTGFDELKSAGFCDHLAFSCHHSPEMAIHAIESFDHFSVLMVPYGKFLPRSGDRLFPLARSKDVGVVGMKPFGGADGALNLVYAGKSGVESLDDLRGCAEPYEAALRWVLATEFIDCTVPGFSSMEEINTAVTATSQAYTDGDSRLLDRIEQAVGEDGILGNRKDLLACFRGAAVPTP